MIKRIICVFAALMVLCGFAGCTVEKEEPALCDPTFTEALNFYISYMETARFDWQKAVGEFLHFEDEESKSLSLRGNPILSYQLIRFEKLSDQLWIVEVFIKRDYIPDGAYGVNFVGIIDGEYRVMNNKKKIP